MHECKGTCMITHLKRVNIYEVCMMIIDHSCLVDITCIDEKKTE